MRFPLLVAALLSWLCWPLAVWQSQKARRRLKAYTSARGSGHLTLERVA